jgi:hypothetical protein
MAEYKYPGILKQTNAAPFDSLYHPATPAPFSGVYHCHVCGHEAVSTKGNPLPPQNHHQHSPAKPILWRLIVASTHV